MRERHLTFGGRLLCPFLRPFFLDPADEGRVKRAAETLWRLGERLAEAAAARRRAHGGARAERRGDRRWRGSIPATAWRARPARADAFILPDSLQFAEYNAESPAGPGYSQRLAELFDGEPLMERFRERFDVRHYTPIAQLLDALLESYQDWGGTANLPRIAIVDWREVPTWSEFELLRDAFTDAGVPTVICDPRDLVFDGGRLVGQRRAHRSGLPPRPHQRHRRAPGRVPRAGRRVPRRRRLRGQQPALQDSAQEGVLRRADRRPLQAPVRRRRPARRSRRTCRGRAWCATRGTTRDGQSDRPPGVPAPPPRAASCSSRTTNTAAPA